MSIALSDAEVPVAARVGRVGALVVLDVARPDTGIPDVVERSIASDLEATVAEGGDGGCDDASEVSGEGLEVTALSSSASVASVLVLVVVSVVVTGVTSRRLLEREEEAKRSHQRNGSGILIVYNTARTVFGWAATLPTARPWLSKA